MSIKAKLEKSDTALVTAHTILHNIIAEQIIDVNTSLNSLNTGYYIRI